MEILVLDDGSTDNTAEVLAPYGARITYHRQANAGVALARTAAGRLAKGELIAFQDDDDLMAPDRLEVLYAALIDHPRCVFAVGDIAVIGPQTRLDEVLATHREQAVTSSEVFDFGYEAVMWPRVPATNHTTLFRRVDAERIGWFDPDYNMGGEDKDFFARLGLLGPVVHVRRVVSYYRRGHNSMTSRRFVTEFVALRRFQRHLHRREFGLSIELETRLRERMLAKLNQMSRIRAGMDELPVLVDPDYLTSALADLTRRQRMAYWWDANVRVPIVSFARHMGLIQNRHVRDEAD